MEDGRTENGERRVEGWRTEDGRWEMGVEVKMKN